MNQEVKNLNLTAVFKKKTGKATILIPSSAFDGSRRGTTLSSYDSVISIVTGRTLFRSYGRYIAEFLSEESLVHLGLLDLSTCVGLRYG